MQKGFFRSLTFQGKILQKRLNFQRKDPHPPFAKIQRNCFHCTSREFGQIQEEEEEEETKKTKLARYQ
jgi:plastocyanin domain-containing protein